MRRNREIVLISLCCFLVAIIVITNIPRNSFLHGSGLKLSGDTQHPRDGNHGNRHQQSHGDPEKLSKHPVFTGSNMYVYWPPPHSGMTRPGAKFNVDIRIAKEIKEMSRRLYVLNDQTVDKFVFMTAASTNHFEEAIDAVASVQHFFPGRKIVYYDLGLRNYQIDLIRSWKGVEYRKFDFAPYPQYFQSNLRRAGWKPIVIQEVMAEYGAVFWMDASVRFLTGNLSFVYDAVMQNGGIMLFKSTKHSNFAATHKGTYGYLPTNRSRQAETPMCIATAILAYNTKVVFYNVLWWFFLCALDESCQAPMPKTMCDFDLENKWATFANCHKWDQSTLNVLLSNYFGYRHHRYLQSGEILAIERWPTSRYSIQTRQDEH